MAHATNVDLELDVVVIGAGTAVGLEPAYAKQAAHSICNASRPWSEQATLAS